MPHLLTNELVESVIRDLPAQARVMLRLLLLQYLDVTPEDIEYIAGDRPDPRFQAGAKSPLAIVTREAVQGVADRAEEYRTRHRRRRERLSLMIECLNRQIPITETFCSLSETLLRTRFGLSPSELADLKANARTAVLKQRLREVEAKLGRGELANDDYRRARLMVEYQLQLRLLDRHRKRLDLAKREMDLVGLAPLQDHEIAHIWGLPVSSLGGRKVKHLHQYLERLQTALRQSGWPPDPAQAMPLDLWKETLCTLSARPTPRSVASYDGMEGSEATLLDKLRAFAMGALPEEAESRLWLDLIQDLRHGAEPGSRPRSLFGLQRLSTILAEMDQAPETLEQELLGRIAPPTHEEPEPQPEEKKLESVQLGDMAEHVLRSMRGD